jgi:hypothetical protein
MTPQQTAQTTNPSALPSNAPMVDDSASQPADIATLPEYANNPFIAKLPGILSQSEWVTELRGKVEYNPHERGYPAKLRKHCVLRLLDFFEPLTRQVVLAERLDMVIRRGYMSRNPNVPGYALRLAGAARRAMTGGGIACPMPNFHPTALSFALTGCSGVGKTRAEERVLSRYPQVIEHRDLQMTQLVWLKLESPRREVPNNSASISSRRSMRCSARPTSRCTASAAKTK